MTREYSTEVIYKVPGESVYFVSPDSIGRYFYDTLEEAREESGLDKVRTATAAQCQDGYSD